LGYDVTSSDERLAMPSVTIGIRELKSHLSAYVRRVKAGETVVITERGKPVGRLIPMEGSRDETLRRLGEAGVLSWSGRKPRPLAHRPPRVRGDRTISDLLLEDRD
jgi:prevent-host-death family protein